MKNVGIAEVGTNVEIQPASKCTIRTTQLQENSTTPEIKPEIMTMQCKCKQTSRYKRVDPKFETRLLLTL